MRGPPGEYKDVWDAKPVLREVYGNFLDRIAETCEDEVAAAARTVNGFGRAVQPLWSADCCSSFANELTVSS